MEDMIYIIYGEWSDKCEFLGTAIIAEWQDKATWEQVSKIIDQFDSKRNLR